MWKSNILLYISRLLYPKYHPFWFLLYMYGSYYKIYKRSFKYSLKTLPREVIQNLAFNVPQCFCDINNCVIVNNKRIYLSDVILKCSKLEDDSVVRYVYVLSSQNCPKDILIVTEAFSTNFGESALVKLQSIANNHITFAEEILLSLVSCPSDVQSSLINQILEGYFKSPKLVRSGDILEINIKTFAQGMFYLNTKINVFENLYFKCNKVLINDTEVSGCYFCAVGETTLKLAVNVQSYLPKKIEIPTRVVHLGNKVFNTVNMLPRGLEEYFNQMERAVKPFLRKRNLNLMPVFLVQGEAGCGKHVLVEALAAKYGMHIYKVDNFELTANVYAQNEVKLNNVFFTTQMAAPCVLYVNSFENFGRNNEGQYDERITSYFINSLHNLFDKNEYPVLLFCSSNDKDIPADLKRAFLEVFQIDAPTDVERREMLEWIIEENSIILENVDLFDVANKTHGFFFQDLKTLVYYTERFSQREGLEYATQDLVLKAVDHMQSSYNESIGAPKVPKVQWSDVGGLNDVKEEIIKTVNLPLKHPELLKKSGLKRSGILLFGPPGTGKTLIAKAVATECSLCFLSVKGPELLNMYVGQSEQNVRDVFERARQASPCIIFFDELDSLAPNRGMSGDSGGVMDRVVSQLLAEMDGLNKSGTVFVIGATNRPDLIDPALLRPGRFDKLLYVGPCTDFESKNSVLKALTRKFNLSSGLDLEEVVKVCPQNITGADFYGICSSAWSMAARRLIESVEKGKMDAENMTYKDVIVNLEDFKFAIQNVKPSISSNDLKYFEKLKLELGSNVV